MMEDEPNFNFANDLKYEEDKKLRNFYDKFFPYELFYEWLTLNHTTTNNNQDLENEIKKSFERREFSFRFIKDEKEITVRNRSFGNVQQFKEYIKGRETVNREDGTPMIDFIPIRFDIGPVYSWEPSKQSMVTDYYPVSKELVFDIDVDDYNDIRICCSNQSICSKCWGFLSIAAKFLDHYLRDCYGFEQIMFVFSGRRGLHCWVSDRSALFLSKENRSSIINHIRTELTSNQLPILKYSYDNIFLPYFENHIIDEQSIFSNQKQKEKFLSLLPITVSSTSSSSSSSTTKKDKTIIKPLESIKSKLEEIQSTSTDREIWFAIKNYLIDNNLHDHLYHIIFNYTMPRLDEPVTIGFNHLLKAPFCIHPDTKKLCIPLDIKEIDQLDPDDVPTLDQLLKDEQQGLKIFNKYKQQFKNHISKIQLKRNLSNDKDKMDF